MKLKEIKKPHFYSFKEVAKFMEIGTATLHRMIKSGRIKFINVAKSGTKPIYGFRVEDIQFYYDNLSKSSKKN